MHKLVHSVDLHQNLNMNHHWPQYGENPRQMLHRRRQELLHQFITRHQPGNQHPLLLSQNLNQVLGDRQLLLLLQLQHLQPLL